jgi:hypothetical protein
MLGTIDSLYRYPVKGLTPEPLERVVLEAGSAFPADRLFALVPLPPDERGEGRRTYVHVEGLAEPLVASRSERAIMVDVEAALAEAAGIPRRRRAEP